MMEERNLLENVQEIEKEIEYRKVPIPAHRLTPLKKEWMNIYKPLVEHLKLQVRFNPKIRGVELRTCPSLTSDIGAIQKAADFINAFALGFQVQDALVILRLEDIFIDSFEIKDIKALSGEHLIRAVGRLAGKDGKTKTVIENTSRTRIVLADNKIHILGSWKNIRIAKDAIVDLILGSTPGKVYNKLRNIASRLVERSM